MARFAFQVMQSGKNLAFHGAESHQISDPHLHSHNVIVASIDA